jgi:hypothetical protein
VSVAYATGTGGTAHEPFDYTAVNGILSFLPGQVSQVVSVLVRGDNQYESGETFYVNLSQPVNSTLGDAQGKGLIVDDDPALGADGAASGKQGRQEGSRRPQI